MQIDIAPNFVSIAATLERLELKNQLQLKVSRATYTTLLLGGGLLILFLIMYIKTNTILAFGEMSWPVYAYSIIVTFFALSRIIASFFYKSPSLVFKQNIATTYWQPEVTFVIPAKNEEDVIGQVISHCYEVDYPQDKIEVIVIDDGSTDATWQKVLEMKKKYPSLVVIHWEKNKGKRHGMAEGFRRAKGEIVIQIDSDSMVDQTSFRNLLIPFQERSVGAVCAHCFIRNNDTNLLTRMQAAYYYLSFKILKAAESAFMTVFCCSGPCAAYRKSYVLPLIDEWLNEKFLGVSCTFGDDRALTSRVVKAGYKTIYADDAEVYTIVPEKLKKFIKQMIRWKKSWIINAVKISSFIWKTNPFVAFTYFFPLIALSLLVPIVVFRAIVLYPLVNHAIPYYYFLGIFLMTCLMVVCYVYHRRDKYWKYFFAWTGAGLLLAFLVPYALLTIRNNGWGTR